MPMRFLVGAGDEQAVEALRGKIEEMRKSGVLAKIIARMRLD